ncbi:hypothetical protein T4C_5205 [Trichinella pseudospiralis]|uniref:Uncharacterized protein n=1 Tax=Trichinella pseudospiralis TaxID=6337 RepID=A0A0V1JXI4_TRIPS|nr:hypothetical protein T4C_5205 [Trichinella pseudospiralis]
MLLATAFLPVPQVDTGVSLLEAGTTDEVKTRTTGSRSRTTRSRTVDEDIRYMWFPKGPNSVSLG